MKTLEKVALLAGLIVVGVTALYRYVLNDEQKDALREASNTIRDATQEVSDSVAPFVSNGPTHAEEESRAAASRAATKAQWEALGY
ncbi:MAG: hypothetical protein IKG22_02570 [Atopobiaceae bacterium]|nr:hypothetical protein [Atopobiaceae bacterium]